MVPLPNEKKFSFKISGLPDETFYVLQFRGEEGLSRLSRFELDLVAETGELDLAALLKKPAELTIHADRGDVPVQGVVSEMEQRHGNGRIFFYRAVLTPKSWWLTLTTHNQVFLDQTVPEIISAALLDGGLSPTDFELRLKNDYQALEYTCQYRQTHFEFISRLMEKYGLYYFFEPTPQGEKMVVTDTALAHARLELLDRLTFSPPSGLGEGQREEVFHSFFCRRQSMPAAIRLKDYNYEKPGLEVKAEKIVEEGGRGEVYLYGHHFKTPEEGDKLAGIMAESYLCRRRLFIGQGRAPYLRPGRTFELDDHFRDEYNQEYLVAALEHRGDQTGRLQALGLKEHLPGRRQEPYYHNTCEAIPASLQFRPESKTEPSRFHGVLHAKIDAAQSGRYAELDDQGRYKVVLPFDLAGREPGKASCYLRLMQPYAGSDHGMHLPLLKDTEVLLTFIDGDPDRPVIAGAVPNPESTSVVTSDNNTQSRITTSGGNRIHMEDQDGNQRILMHSPTSESYFRIGSPNDPESDIEWLGDKVGEGLKSAGEWAWNAYEDLSDGGVKLFSIGDLDIKVQISSKTVLGDSQTVVLGDNSETSVLMNSNTYLGWDSQLNLGSVSLVKLATNTEYDTFKSYLVGTWSGIKDTAVSVKNAPTRIANGFYWVANKVIKLKANKNMIVAEEITVNDEKIEVEAAEQKIVSTAGLIIDEEDEIVSERSSIISESSSVIEEETKVVDERTSVISSDTLVADDETKVVSESTDVNTSKAIVAGSVDFL